jgi:hypothetical protein
MDDPQIIRKGLFARTLDLVQKINVIWAALVGLAMILSSIWAALNWPLPNISITPGIIASNSSPLETEYIIKSIGNNQFI